MSVRVVLLTTDTPHHQAFARRVHDRVPVSAIFAETQELAATFPTFHHYERERDEHERHALLGGTEARFKDVAETYEYGSMNDPDAVQMLRALRPDVAIVFGTRRLRPPVIAAASVACLNLHGGNPEHYRGLDTHLWAIYHRDFDNLVTTLHYVDEDLDTGDIVGQAQLRIPARTRLHELRAINTEVCVNLSLAALHTVTVLGVLPSRRQLARGRYYSFMPAVLKEECVRVFARHTGAA